MNDKRERILVSAIKLFTEKGIDQTTLKDIAEDSRTSTGALFYYYPTKNDLLYEVLDICIEEMTITLQRVITRFQKDSILEALRYTIEKLLVNDFIMKVNFYLAEQAMVGDQIILSKLKEKYGIWRKELRKIFFINTRRGQTEEELDEQQVNASVSILLAVIDGICLQYLLDPSGVNIKDISTQLARIIDNEIQNKPMKDIWKNGSENL